MEISGKGELHFHQDTPSLIGNQTNHRINMFSLYLSNCCCESDYECICIVIHVKTRSVPLNILTRSVHTIKKFPMGFSWVNNYFLLLLPDQTAGHPLVVKSSSVVFPGSKIYEPCYEKPRLLRSVNNKGKDQTHTV